MLFQILAPLLPLPASLISSVQCISETLCKFCAEEEKAAAEAEAAVAAREATPEVSEEGEIPVDPEEMEVLSKAQQQPAPKIGHQHSPTRRHTSDRGRDRAPDRDRGPPGRDRQAFNMSSLVLLLPAFMQSDIQTAWRSVPLKAYAQCQHDS